jgi:hypothetical protein
MLISLAEKARAWLAQLFGSKAQVGTEELRGEWRLVRVAGRAPASYRIRSLVLSIEESGHWSTEAVMADSGDGMTVKANGEWRLQGTLMRHNAGMGWEVSRVAIDEGRLVLTPDFTLIGRDGEPATAEYER